MKLRGIVCVFCFPLLLSGCNEVGPTHGEKASSEIYESQSMVESSLNSDKDSIHDASSTDTFITETDDTEDQTEAPKVENAENLDMWIGKYALFEDISQPGLSPVVRNTVIEIDMDDTGYFANIYVDGHTVLLRIRATVIGNEESVSIYFDKWNEYPEEFYTQGDLLFTMYAEEELYTSWGKMKPLDAENNNRGTHFQRIDEEFFNFLQGF